MYHRCRRICWRSTYTIQFPLHVQFCTGWFSLTGVRSPDETQERSQSERDVSADTSARKNSWPLCLHARGPHAGHTQTLAYASQCVTAERVSTGVCVHHARVSWIPKQPGIICPSPAKATCAHSCPFCVRPTLRRRCRSAMSAGACVWSTVEHAQATSEKAAKADVGTFSMAAATQRVTVAASALACPLGPS